MGTGDSNQGALELTDNLRWLLVVNAGDNTVSSLKVTPHGLKIADVVDADGERPISVTVHHNLVYGSMRPPTVRRLRTDPFTENSSPSSIRSRYSAPRVRAQLKSSSTRR